MFIAELILSIVFADSIIATHWQFSQLAGTTATSACHQKTPSRSFPTFQEKTAIFLGENLTLEDSLTLPIFWKQFNQNHFLTVRVADLYLLSSCMAFIMVVMSFYCILQCSRLIWNAFSTAPIFVTSPSVVRMVPLVL